VARGVSATGLSVSGKESGLSGKADNLKLAAVNAILCALELGRLRPSGKVQ